MDIFDLLPQSKCGVEGDIELIGVADPPRALDLVPRLIHPFLCRI